MLKQMRKICIGSVMKIELKLGAILEPSHSIPHFSPSVPERLVFVCSTADSGAAMKLKVVIAKFFRE